MRQHGAVGVQRNAVITDAHGVGARVVAQSQLDGFGGIQFELGDDLQGATGEAFDPVGCTTAATPVSAIRLAASACAAMVSPNDPAASYTIISGSGAVSGTFANAPVSGQRYTFGAYRAKVTYTANSVVLSECRQARGAV